ncbi:ras protein [Rhodocollybia butyracea]|uniref:Ras protein n=1 Tax=Rhodocollybia butyracea TaxID=206335 RepID=A0A9P5U2K7_9AGAR|nr:ras protein [Rhodocollybia butyracea]
MDYWRITLLGDGGTGKTALAVRAYDPTIEDSWRKQAKVDNRMSLVEIIDTAGQVITEKSPTIIRLLFSQGQAFALVFSLLSRTTFERIKSFHQVMVRNKGQAVPFVLVGNKSDRIEEREITEEEGAELAMSFGCPYIESSARTGNRVDDVFYGLVRKLRFGGESKGQKHVETTRGSRQHKSRSCIVM